MESWPLTHVDGWSAHGEIVLVYVLLRNGL